MGNTNNNVASVLDRKHLHKKIPSFAALETYEKKPIFIPVNIMEDVVKLVAQKLPGSTGLVDTDSEALYGWLLNLRSIEKDYVLAWKLSLTG